MAEYRELELLKELEFCRNIIKTEINNKKHAQNHTVHTAMSTLNMSELEFEKQKLEEKIHDIT